MPDAGETTADEPAAALRETHSAVVVLLGDRAYKVKKPVDLGFLDFSTPERREQACRRELVLNRRLAPDVYLGIAEVTDPEGRPCEHLLVMRRMPEARRLSTLVGGGADVSDELRRLARDLAAFHATAGTNGEISESGSPTALEQRWRDNVATLTALRPCMEELRDVSRYAFDYIAGRGRLLEARMTAGLVRDGHGDLLADDIFCLPEGPRALDCLDFDDRLRWMDVLDDVACLAMDLERLGAPIAAARFLRDYAEFSGTPHPDSLKHHYIAYRAVMRAEVAAIRSAQRRHSDRVAQDAGPLRSLVGLGLQHLQQGQVRLVLVGGGAATGKTTFADALAEHTGFAVLSSDRCRKEMLGLDPLEHHPAAYGQGIYTPELTDRTYRRLADQAAHLLSMGESVVVDASFTGRQYRTLFADLALRSKSTLLQLQCRPPQAVVDQRLRRRALVPDAYSDAGLPVGARLAAAAQPWPEATAIDTSMPTSRCVASVLAAGGLAERT